jgi:hypothetical protein
MSSKEFHLEMKHIMERECSLTSLPFAVSSEDWNSIAKKEISDEEIVELFETY